MGRYFGTDGFRGEANDILTSDKAYKIGRFLGWYFKTEHEKLGNPERPKVVIGKDTRRSSYMFEYSIVAGVVSSGTDAYMMHVTTTPSVAYITRADSFDCGIMISASHNQFSDNGIKLLNSHGEKIDDSFIAMIEDYIDGKFTVDSVPMVEVPFAKGREIGETVDYSSGRNRYIGYLISLGIFSFKGKRIGLDAANGASWMIAKAVFEALGAKVYAINNDPNGFNINDNCGSTHMESLRELVIEKKLDVGFAFDGDADRCLAVDENGNIINGDHILYIYAKYLKERDKLLHNTVVTTVMSNLGLYKAFDQIGIEYAQTPVGDRYVYEYMAENGNRLGGEQSGHIIFTKYATTGDGILTSLKIMEVMLARKTELSKLAEPMKMYPQILENVHVLDKETALNDFDVKTSIEEAAKMLGDRGRVLVRASGTEPVVRVMAEAETEELCKSAVNIVIDTMKSKGLII